MADVVSINRPPLPARSIDRPLTITLFADRAAQSKKQIALPLRKLGDMIARQRAKTKESLPLLKLASFGDERSAKGCYRTNANLLAVDGVEIDHDAGTMSLEQARGLLAEAGLTALLYSTPSHSEAKPRWRALLPTSVSLDGHEWRERLVARAQGVLQGGAGGESFVLSQSYYFGAVDGEVKIQIVDARRCIDQAFDLDDGALDKKGLPYNGPRPERVKRIPRAANLDWLPEDGDELWPAPDWELIESALDAIPPAERERYKLWSRITMAIHAAGYGSREAFEVADRWSMGRPGDWVVLYHPGELAAKWKTYGAPSDGETVGVGTIFYEASLRGWKDPRKRRPEFDPDELTVAAWLERDLPPMQWLLGELLSTTSRGLLVGPTGLGKTNFALALAFAAAEGKGFLHWQGSGKPCRVLYIDGEMSRSLLQERLRDAVCRVGSKPGTLFAFSTEDFPDLSPLNTSDGQQYIDETIEKLGGLDLVIFDNIQSLIPGDLRDTEAWQNVLPWARDLTRREIGQLWIHHTGLDKTHGYGDSSREWQLDFVALMTRAESGADIAFTLDFQKARQRKPANRANFAPVLITLANDEWVSMAAPVVLHLSRLTPSQQGALAELDALIASGENTTEERWREVCIAGRLVSQSESYANRKAVFNKAKRDLLKMGLVVVHGDRVWRGEAEWGL